ncbi:hypothetical protein H072_11598 [Dactylellina haptotyla CBS 200.50]|uniref:EGF-like domain-containing protein n=1 Tax=Dactylellina haptotyla (strain CBS 200.50) TaxID=1284197 RepID=S7ZX87_DACHA|nr:hypothetical protein H072_11598 [Dactylellina haptotyla CBS 200.50]
MGIKTSTLGSISFFLVSLSYIHSTAGSPITKALSIRDGPLIPEGKSDPTVRWGAKEWNDKSWYEEFCTLGIYENGITEFRGGWWEGAPLGRVIYQNQASNPFNNNCMNVKDLQPKLDATISSYKVTGWCECEFYGGENCDEATGRFTAYNRYDPTLWLNGPDDNAIKSIRCWATQHQEDFHTCDLKLIDFSSEHNGRNGPTPTEEGGVRTNIFSETLFGGDLASCRRPNANEKYRDFILTEAVVAGCTCAFFSDENCSVNVVQSGNMGTERTPGTYQPGYKSYMCFYPFGIPYTPRRN